MFCKSVHWSFRKYWFPSYAAFPNVNACHCTISKMPFIHITACLIKVVRFMLADTNFQNSSFCLKVYSLSLATTTVGYFSWSNMLTHSFLRKWLPNIKVCITVICLLVIFSSQQFVPWEKYLPNSASDSLDCCLKLSIVFWLLQSALCVLAILLFGLLKRLKGRVNEIINLYCFIKDGLMKNWYFASYFSFHFSKFKPWVCGREEYKYHQYSLMPLHWFIP